MPRKNILVHTVTLCLILFYFLKRECEAQSCYVCMNQFGETYSGCVVDLNKVSDSPPAVYGLILDHKDYLFFYCMVFSSNRFTLQFRIDNDADNFCSNNNFLSPATFIIKFLHRKHPWHQSSDDSSVIPCVC
jgi:hypothetical protein